MSTLNPGKRITRLALALVLALAANLRPAMAAGPCGATYTVVAGDTLYSLARRCGTTVAAIQQANPGLVNPAQIYAGQVLQVPATGGGGEGSGGGTGGGVAGATTYVVQPGDTLTRIALRFSTTIAAILAANPSVTNPALIYVGQSLTIPATGSGGSTGSGPQVKTYWIARGDQGQSGKAVGCGDSVVPVTASIAPTIAPLRAALEALFAVKTETYGLSGLYNALYQSDLHVRGINLHNGLATIDLTGQLRLGGECDDPRALAQITETALQFSTVHQAQVWLNGQPWPAGPGGYGLTLDQLQNAEYTTTDGPVKLTNGKFSGNVPPGSPVTLNLTLESTLAFGDLSGDGVDDAAVILTSDTGGTGRFRSLAAVLNDQGQPKHVASTDLGDRVQVKSVTIQSGQITLDMIVHGPGDAACCPTQPQTQVYQLQGNQLVRLP